MSKRNCRHLHRAIALLTASALTVSGISANDARVQAAKKKAPALSVSSITLKKGQTKKIKIKANKQKIKKVTWKVDKKKLKITKSTKKYVIVRALKDGSASISVKIVTKKKTYTKKIKAKITPDKKSKKTKKPKATKKPKETKQPKPTNTPKETPNVKPTEIPTITSEPATNTPEATAVPEPTSTPEITTAPTNAATATPDVTATPSVTADPAPVITSVPDTPVTPATTTPSTGPTTVTDAATGEQLLNKSWGGLVSVNLDKPFNVSPGDKVEISLSAHDANGNILTDVVAAVLFSCDTTENNSWMSRVGLQTGHNPENQYEYRWIPTDGNAAELFNTLPAAKTMKSVTFQIATPSAALSESDYISVSIDKIVVTPANIGAIEKNAEEVAALNRLIETVNTSGTGAYVSPDLDSSMYTWNREGHLTEIEWNDCSITGEISLVDFPSLKYFICYNNQLTGFDVTSNPELVFLDCNTNRITNIDVSKNVKLTHLYCQNNLLTTIDVRKNTELTWYQWDDTVTVVQPEKNPEEVAALTQIIEEQTASGATISADLDSEQYVWNTQGHLTDIRWTDYNGGYGLSGSLSFAAFPSLDNIDCSNSQITDIDVSNNTALTFLYCHNNQLTNIDVSNNTALIYFVCGSNQLTNLDVRNNTALQTLGCESNQLTSLDVSKNTGLINLFCRNNKLTNLDVSKNTKLITLSCETNQLTSLDVSNNTALQYLYCHHNLLTTLDVSKHPDLIVLNCDDITVKKSAKNAEEVAALNQIIEAQNNAGATVPADLDDDVYDWSPNGHLLSIRWNNCNLSGSLSLAGFPALHSLDCGANNLSNIDVSHNENLLELTCSDNQLTNLDVSKNTELSKLV